MNFEAKSILESYISKTSKQWLLAQEKVMQGLFRRMKLEIPAYKKFLAANKFKLTSSKDLTLVPSVTKQNYFRKYPFQTLFRKDDWLNNGMVMTATSGSTGEPTYFARNDKIDWQYSVLAEFFLHSQDKIPTLLINCFGMGVWIGGVITYQAFKYAGLRDNPITVISPGINKKEIFYALNHLAPKYKNVIISGYPPFLKDVIDEADEQGVSFRKFKTRLLFAAESFSESFRNYMAEKVRIKDVFRDTLNIYGSAELGAMAFETPMSILIRRLAFADPELHDQIFLPGKFPTLVQYNPEFVAFTEEAGNVLISADSAMPFFKYKIGDHGGVLSFDRISEIFAERGINLEREARNKKIPVLKLPFVFVYERRDFSTKLYGAIMYPEHIRLALHQKQLQRSLTGKFTMITRHDSKHNQFLEIHIELKKGKSANKKLKSLVSNSVVASLLKYNAEYKNNFSSIPQKVKPHFVFWSYNDPNYFASGIKQKWVKQ